MLAAIRQPHGTRPRTQTTRRLDQGSEAADKLPNLREERSIQDRKSGYRLLKKQRQAKRAQQKLKDQRERLHADAWADYRDRLEGDWPIIKRDH